MDKTPTITIVIPCFNEEENVLPIYEAANKVMATASGVAHKFLFVDNASTDRTREILRNLAGQDRRVKVILNQRNFGTIRSPFYGLLQATGDAVVLMAADFQDPPDLIPRFIEKWQSGAKVVAGIKTSSREHGLKFRARQAYYDLLSSLSNVRLLKQFTGFALYDRRVLEEFRKCNDPLPYLRGLVSELGFEPTTIEFDQPLRRAGKSKNSLATLFEFAMAGFVSHTQVPLRLATFAGFFLGCFSLFVAFAYAAYKLFFWNSFQVGVAPLVIGLFFFASIQLFFLGIVGEYVGAILTQVRRRQLVVEAERLNFDH